MEFTAETIAAYLGGTVEGDADATVSTFAKIEEGHPGALSFLANPKYEHYIYDTLSSVVIVDRNFEPKNAVRATLVRVEDAYASFAKLLELYASHKPRRQGISDRAAIDERAELGSGCYVGAFAVIEAGARIGDNVCIYPNAYIGEGVAVGDNTTIYAGAKIYEGCRIGSNVIIHAGAVIGADGFGFAPDDKGGYAKIPQIGNVVVEDDVEIGANTCIDRATMGSTVIRRGVKLDNLIQIGHNVVVGEHTVCASQVGVAGTSKIGRHCMLGGQVGIAGHLTIGDDVQLGSKSGISNNIPDGTVYFGYPALPISRYHRANAVFRNLPELSKTVYRMEKQLNELTGKSGE
ncbi:MAG TPA: UDP-3-O-(3-hydroxymyristoyl)glucosamine N-acyltransferase [Candidatus Tidjanibacter gallistercoris]|nr:UDP-3-O-(3-hydroxymyristoyl)glucosamine N-acyltransferase [Candidatus Tidjanibacter gallistercoris]